MAMTRDYRRDWSHEHVIGGDTCWFWSHGFVLFSQPLPSLNPTGSDSTFPGHQATNRHVMSFKAVLSIIQQTEPEARLVEHFNLLLRDRPPSQYHSEPYTSPLLVSTNSDPSFVMVHVPANGHCLYECVIVGLRHEQLCRRLSRPLPERLSVSFLREIVMSKAEEYLSATGHYDKATASFIAENAIKPETQGSNYGGLVALEVLAHKLHFQANIYDEIGGHCQLVRPSDTNLPLLSISRIHLVSGNNPSVPLFSHPVVRAQLLATPSDLQPPLQEEEQVVTANKSPALQQRQHDKKGSPEDDPSFALQPGHGVELLAASPAAAKLAEFPSATSPAAAQLAEFPSATAESGGFSISAIFSPEARSAPSKALKRSPAHDSADSVSAAASPESLTMVLTNTPAHSAKDQTLVDSLSPSLFESPSHSGPADPTIAVQPGRQEDQLPGDVLGVATGARLPNISCPHTNANQTYVLEPSHDKEHVLVADKADARPHDVQVLASAPPQWPPSRPRRPNHRRRAGPTGGPTASAFDQRCFCNQQSDFFKATSLKLKAQSKASVNFFSPQSNSLSPDFSPQSNFFSSDISSCRVNLLPRQHCSQVEPSSHL